MTPTEKFQAMTALVVDQPYVSAGLSGQFDCSLRGIEIKDGSILGGVGGTGKSFDEAVEACWEELTDLKPGAYIVRNASGDKRRAFKWNGFMWDDVYEVVE